MDAMMVDGEAEGLFAGTPGDHGAFSGSMATPPLTDAHSMPTDTSRVSHRASSAAQHDNSTVTGNACSQQHVSSTCCDISAVSGSKLKILAIAVLEM